MWCGGSVVLNHARTGPDGIPPVRVPGRPVLVRRVVSALPRLNASMAGEVGVEGRRRKMKWIDFGLDRALLSVRICACMHGSFVGP